MKFVHDGTKIEDLFFVKIEIEPLIKDMQRILFETWPKVPIIDSVYTDGTPAMLGNTFFVKLG